MRLTPDGGRQFDNVVLLFLFALFLLVSPLREWWAGDRSPWFMPYVIWAAIIVLRYRLTRRRGRNDL